MRALLIFIVALSCIQSLAHKDPYAVLGVDKKSSDDEIKRAYRKLALKYHPDKNPKGQAKFLEIQKAWEVLGDSEKREQFDHSGGTDRFYSQQQEQQHHQQQQQQWGGGWGAWNEATYESLLPSATPSLSSTNIRQLVFSSDKAWLIQLYSHDNQGCRSFSSTWESLWKTLGGEGGMAQMGRVHWRTQTHLIYWISQRVGGWAPLREEELPIIIGCPPWCREFSCMTRFRGITTPSELQDFIAGSLLGLKPIPIITLASLDSFLASTPSFKVPLLAFGKAEGHGSLPFRILAKNQGAMMRFARVSAPNATTFGPEAIKWQERIRANSHLPSPPFFIVLRGPGSDPEVIKASSGKGAISEIEKLITSKGLSWQHLPAFRPSTLDALGCGTFDQDGSKRNSQKQPLADLCIVLLSPNGPSQHTGRANALKVSSYIHSLHGMDLKGLNMDAAAEKMMRSMSKATSEGKLRVLWMDSDVQRDFCSYHLNDAESSKGVQEGASGNGARSPSPCGQPVTYESLVDQSKEALASLARRFAGWRMSPDEEARRRRPALLLAFRPVSSAMSRDGLGRPLAPSKRQSYVYSVLDMDLSDPKLDLSEPFGSGRSSRLIEVVDWIARAHSSALQAPKTGAGSFFGQAAKPPLPPLQLPSAGHFFFPPPLLPDDQPSILDKLLKLISDLKEWIVRSLSFLGVDLSSSFPSKELSGTVLIVILLVLVQLAWSRVSHPNPYSQPQPPHQATSSRYTPARDRPKPSDVPDDDVQREAIHRPAEEETSHHEKGLDSSNPFSEVNEAEREAIRRQARDEMAKREALRKRLKDTNIDQ